MSRDITRLLQSHFQSQLVLNFVANSESSFNLFPLYTGESESAAAARKRKRRSRWAPEGSKPDSPSSVSSLLAINVPPPGYQGIPAPVHQGQGTTPSLSRITRTEPGLLRYAMQTFGTTSLSEEDWKKAEDHYKVKRRLNYTYCLKNIKMVSF